MKKLLSKIIYGDISKGKWEKLGDLCPPEETWYAFDDEQVARLDIAATIVEEFNPDISMTLDLLDDLMTKHPEMFVELDKDLLNKMEELVEGVDIEELKHKEGDFKMCWACRSEVEVKNHYIKSMDIEISLKEPCSSCQNKECDIDTIPCMFCSKYPG